MNENRVTREYCEHEHCLRLAEPGRHECREHREMCLNRAIRQDADYQVSSTVRHVKDMRR